MLRRVDSSKVSSTRSTAPVADAGALRGQLRVGQVLPVRVIRSVGEGHFLIDLLGQNIHAESHLDLTRDRLHVQVATLWPKIHLRLVPSREENPEWLQCADEQQIDLTPFAQYMLARLGAKSRKRPVREALDSLKRWVNRRSSQDFLSPERILDFMEEAPELPALLSAVLDEESAPEDDDDPLTLLGAILEEPVFAPVTISSKSLAQLNTLLITHRIALSQWRWRDRVLLIERESPEGLPHRFRYAYESSLYGLIGVEWRAGANGLILHLDFEHSVAASAFSGWEATIRRQLHQHNLSVANCSFSVRALPPYLSPEEFVDSAV
jgi:hypothetical protein